MAMLGRAGLVAVVHRQVGLSRTASARFVEDVIEAIVEWLAAGEDVKISGSGSVTPRDEGTQMGRNPKSGKEALIAVRRGQFRLSPTQKRRMNAGISGGRTTQRVDEDLGTALTMLELDTF